MAGGAPNVISSQPVSLTGDGYQPAGVAAVTGTFSGTGASAAFIPKAGRDFSIWLGACTGVVQLECSPPGDGSNWYVLSVNGTQMEKWTNPAAAFAEQWSCSEAGTQFRLNCTAYTSGTPAYRLSQ